ncbi:MAG: hypothetical protein NWQ09_09610 [Nonlabens sp.]|nr:hypothetical protein [Nonlabens sp.]
MKKLLVLFLICFPLINVAQDSKQTEVDSLLTAKAEKLYFKDQKWRRTLTSLVSSNCETRTSANSSPNSKKGKIAHRLFFNDLINITDEQNTKELIALTTQYGFPGMNRLGNKHPVYIVFVHSDETFFPEIIRLVQKEHTLGNMTEWEKDHILWHVERKREGYWLQPNKPVWFGTDEDIMNYFLK